MFVHVFAWCVDFRHSILKRPLGTIKLGFILRMISDVKTNGFGSLRTMIGTGAVHEGLIHLVFAFISECIGHLLILEV